MKILKQILFIGVFVFCITLTHATNIRHKVVFNSKIVVDTTTAADGNIYSIIKLTDCSFLLEEGVPKLPIKIINLIIPASEEPDIVTYSIEKAEVIPLDYPVYPVQKPVPASIGFKGNDFVPPDGKIYSLDAYYPAKTARVLRTNCFRGNKVVVIEVSPVIYNPVKGQLEFSESMDINLQLKPSKNIPSTSPVRDKAGYDKFLKTLVANGDDVSKYSVVKEKTNYNSNTQLKSAKTTQLISNDCDYVVITSSSLASYFDDFIEWKKQKGINIELVTTNDIYQNYPNGDQISGINDHAGSIRQFLYDAYNNGNGIEYALLGGDSLNVPFRYGTGYNDTCTWLKTNDCMIPSDLYFSDLEGNWKVDNDRYLGEPIFGSLGDSVDYGAEIFVGRLLCNNSTQIQNWINKLLIYEKNPGNGNRDYLGRAVYSQSDYMMAHNQARDIAGRLATILDSTIVEERYSGIADPGSMYCPDYPKGSDLIDGYSWVNSGFVSWFHHGAAYGVAVATKGDNNWSDTVKLITNYDNTEESFMYHENGNGLDNLSNSNYPFILYSMSCETMPFDTWEGVSPTDNLGAVFTTLNSNGGPIYLGNTRYGFTDNSVLLERIFADCIAEGITRLGEAEASSKGTDGDHYLWLSHNLLGCPETEMWVYPPSLFSNASVAMCGENIFVDANVSGSTICVMTSDDGGDEYREVKYNSDTATFFNVPEPFVVTITKHNYIPKIVYSTQIETNLSSSVSGTAVMCSANTPYSIDEVPEWATITWSQSSNITRISGEHSNPCNFSPNGSGEGWIHARVITACNDTFNLPNKTVWVGVPVIDSIAGASSTVIDQSEYYHVVYDYDSYPTTSWWGATPYYQGLTINPQTGYPWTYITFPEPDNYNVVVQIQNTCGWSSYAFKPVSVSENKSGKILLTTNPSVNENIDGKPGMTVAPNPANEEVTITIEPDNLESFNGGDGWQIEVYSPSNILVEKKTGLKTDKIKLNTQNWVEGVYLIRAKIGGEVLSSKLVIKK